MYMYVNLHLKNHVIIFMGATKLEDIFN